MCYYGVNLPTQAEGGIGASAGDMRSDSSLTSRLTHLDAVIGEHSAAINAIKKQQRDFGTNTYIPRPDDVSLATYNTPATTIQLANSSPESPASSRINELMPMPIPVGHGSTSEDLLRTRALKILLGDYPEDMLLRTEQKRRQPEELESLAVSILKRWAWKSSSIEVMVKIARSISGKRQTVGIFN